MLNLPQLPRSLEASLRDRESGRLEVRLSAVRDLGRHAGPDRSGRALAALRDALVHDGSVQVRGAAAVSLADAGAHTAVPVLIEAMEDVHVHVRQMALLALGELGRPDDERLCEVVRGALSDETPELRFQALIASHRLDVPHAEGTLIASTQDRDPVVRHMAFRLLEERATSDAGVRPGALVTAAIRVGLEDPVLPVRLAAAILLARSGDRSGDAVIAEAIDDPRGVEPADEQAAIVLAGELAIEGARLGLRRRSRRVLFGRDRFPYETQIALARLGDERARAGIARGLTAFRRDTRTLSVVAAGRARLVEAVPVIEAMRGDPSRAEPEAIEDALGLLEAGSGP